MATAPQYLSVEEFERLYGNENGWEYWFGKPIQKPTPTWAHAILQQLVAELLHQAGYVTGPEVELRASSDWRPRPDVACVTHREGRYPNTLDIAIEILSNDESRYILEKCRNYQKAGIPQIFVFDPETQLIYGWNKGLVELEELRLANGVTVAGETIWKAFNHRMGL